MYFIYKYIYIYIYKYIYIYIYIYIIQRDKQREVHICLNNRIIEHQYIVYLYDCIYPEKSLALILTLSHFTHDSSFYLQTKFGAMRKILCFGTEGMHPVADHK